MIRLHLCVYLLNLLLVTTLPMLAAMLVARTMFARSAAKRHTILAAGLMGVWLTPLMMCINFSPWPAAPLPQMMRNFAIEDPSPPANVLYSAPIENPKINTAASIFSVAKIEPLVLIAWMVGTAWLLGRLLISAIAAAALRRNARRLDWPGETSVFTSPRAREPLCVGLVRPIVILPDALPAQLSSAELRAVILHETAHASRRDHCIALAQRLASAIIWPHPLVHWLGRALSQAREESCDNHALQSMPPAQYARLLVRLCETLDIAAADWPTAAMSGSNFPMSKRIAGLLDPRRHIMTSASPRYVAAAVAALAAITAISSTARFSYAQPPTSAVAAETLTPQQKIGQQTIEEFSRNIAKAVADVDDGAFVKLIDSALANDFTIQGYSGLATKDQLMTFLRWHDPNSVHGPAAISDQAIRFYNNDAAIWTGRYDEDLHISGAAVHKTDFFTMVWANRNDKWQIVHLQVLPEEKPAIDPRAGKTPAPAPNPPLAKDQNAYPNLVKFELGKSELRDGDEIVITEVRGTLPQIQAGGRYLVRGRYTLQSHDQAMIAAYSSSRTVPYGYTDPMQQKTVLRGSGTFELALQVPPDGFPHVSLYAGGKGIDKVYFGTGDSVLR